MLLLVVGVSYFTSTLDELGFLSFQPLLYEWFIKRQGSFVLLLLSCAFLLLSSSSSSFILI